MRSLVVGHGSIGQRHVRLLKELGTEVGIVSRRDIAGAFPTIDRALEQFSPGYVVVANETSGHRRALGTLMDRKFDGPILVEKPLWCSRDEPLPTAPRNVRVGYNFRFHPVVQTVRRLLRGRRIVSAEVACGSYLPEWRPGRDYRTTSSALREAGGGALHDLSHELDYAFWLLGAWRRLTALGGHLSNLAIETDDVSMILAETAACPAVSISLNYIERTPRRGIIVNTETDTIIGDLERGTVRNANGAVGVGQFVLDETYRAQHRAMLSGSADDVCTYAEGLAVVDAMTGVERAIATGTWIKNAAGGHP